MFAVESLDLLVFADVLLKLLRVLRVIFVENGMQSVHGLWDSRFRVALRPTAAFQEGFCVFRHCAIAERGFGVLSRKVCECGRMKFRVPRIFAFSRE